jgi:surface protein
MQYQNITSKLAFWACCYRNNIPSELLAIITSFYQKPISHEIMRLARPSFFTNNKYQSTRDHVIMRFGNIPDWDTSLITDMSNFFEKTFFNENINEWNVSNVEDMSCMFKGAIHFNQPLNNWNVSKVIRMDHMFSGAIEFNQPLHNWDVRNVRSMSYMFSSTNKFNQPLNSWNIKKMKNTMFFKAKGFHPSGI